ncbi:MAG: DUF424 domain-containing protein [Candidatus Njordarchaeia archaeon]|nr:DUF424 family protein [Candidatus Korarchaeota archaeon]
MNSEKKAWVKVIETQTGTILAACDEELLGKKLKMGELDIEISPKFYKEHLVDRETLIKLLQTADVLNLVGNFVVSLAENLGLIHSSAKIFFIDANGDKIPHAQMYKFEIGRE